MQREYSYMPTIFDSTTLRAVLRRDRRHSFTHAVRARFREWQRAAQQRKRERALEECLRRLDRHTLDDIGLDPTTMDKVNTEMEMRAIRRRTGGPA